jgi:AcrR family transcriptional regulator
MSTSKSPRGATNATRRAYHHGDLRKALIKVTLELIPTAGVRELSLREVARTAGVSHAASYRHFPSKESLLAAVAEEGFTKLADALRNSVRSCPQDPLARLQAAGTAYVDFGVRHPHHLSVMFGGAISSFDDHPALQAAAAGAHNELRAVVTEVLQGGELRAADEEVVEAAAWSIVHGLTVLLADRQIRSRDGGALSKHDQMRLATAVTGLFCKGLAGILPGSELPDPIAGPSK